MQQNLLQIHKECAVHVLPDRRMRNKTTFTMLQRLRTTVRPTEFYKKIYPRTTVHNELPIFVQFDIPSN
jgi:hypothetical protein